MEKVKRLSTTISNVKCINPFVSLQWHVLTAPAASIPVSFDENAVVALPPPATGRAPPPPSPPPPPPPDLDQAIAEFWRDDYNRGRAISTNTQISLRPDGPGTYTLSVSAIGSCVGQNSSSTASLVVLCNRAPIPDATVAVLDDVTLRGELDDFTPGVASPPSPPTAPPAPAAAPPPPSPAARRRLFAAGIRGAAAAAGPRAAAAAGAHAPHADAGRPEVLQEDRVRRVAVSRPGGRLVHVEVVARDGAASVQAQRASRSRGRARVFRSGASRRDAAPRPRGRVPRRDRGVRRLRERGDGVLRGDRGLGRDVRDGRGDEHDDARRAVGRRALRVARRRRDEAAAAAMDAPAAGHARRARCGGGEEDGGGAAHRARGGDRGRAASAREGGGGRDRGAEATASATRRE